jgi:hypothetical protein
VPLYERNRGVTGGTSLRIHPGARGRRSATRGATAQLEEGDDPEAGLGRSGPHRPGDARWAGAE